MFCSMLIANKIQQKLSSVGSCGIQQSKQIRGPSAIYIHVHTCTYLYIHMYLMQFNVLIFLILFLHGMVQHAK